MNKTFTHSFQDSGDSSMSFSDPKDPTSVTMKVGPDGQFWLTATPEGCLHLAKVFAELGMRSFKQGFHLHKNEHFATDHTAGRFNFAVAAQQRAPGDGPRPAGSARP
jgi:hypothetical protein